MLKKISKNRLIEIFIPILFLIVGFLIWEKAALISSLPEFILPRPSRIILEIINRLEFFLYHLVFSMLSVIIGYFAAILLSFIMAVIFIYSKTVERILYPYIIAIMIAPTLALAPFIVLWFGIGIVSKIIIVILICFSPILVNTIKGLKTTEENTMELLRSFSANKWQTFLKLKLPNSLPFIFQGLKISSTLAMIGVFVGESLAADRGMGYLIVLNTRLLNTDTAMASLLIMILAGLLLFLLICYIEKKVVFWQKPK